MACGIVPNIQYPLQWLKSLWNRGDGTDGSGPYKNKDGETTNDIETITKRAATYNLFHKPPAKPIRILALDAISNTSNMGSILRTAAAFGVDAILLSEDSCDAWYRQAVRVSMGHVVTVPTIRVGELWKEMVCEGFAVAEEDTKCSDGGLPRVLKWLREEMRIQCFAAVVDTDDDGDGTNFLPPLISLESMSESTKDHSSSSWVCVLGNEGHGIREEVVKEASCRIRIGMANGVDSLSLPVAAGILIHGLSLSYKMK
jgi:tRNA G18 (ribose-2'-O)-methylase SpoU